jgi:Na+/glutamate symporter
MLSQSDITQVGMLLAACATLGTVIGVLWKQMLTHFKGIDEKLDKAQEALADCQNDRLQIWQAIARQAGCQVNDLKRDSNQ